MNKILLLFFCASFVLFSCRKDKSGPPEVKKRKLVKVTRGTGTVHDTVFTLQYNAEGLLSLVTGNNNFPNYEFQYENITNRLKRVKNQERVFLEFTYNERNKISSAVMNTKLLQSKFVYEYDQMGRIIITDETPDVVNIRVKYLTAYNNNDELSSYEGKVIETGFLWGYGTNTYSDIDNPFGAFSILNFYNQLGFESLVPGSTFIPILPQKLPANCLINGTLLITNVYEKDEDGNVIKAIITSQGIDQRILGKSTWQFEYDCN